MSGKIIIASECISGKLVIRPNIEGIMPDKELITFRKKLDELLAVINNKYFARIKISKQGKNKERMARNYQILN